MFPEESEVMHQVRKQLVLAISLLSTCALAGQTTRAAPPVGDLRTRTAGTDWPAFLGPTGDNKSSETGLRTDWPKAGPRIVWQQRLGTGYGMPTISRGRLFQFTRIRDQARLMCLRSETGEPLWQFEYPTDYEDLYGYDNGPRSSPVVDGDRVYILGVEGMLHCLGAEDGKLIWKVDTAAQFGVIQNFFGVGSTPVIEGDLLIANLGGSPSDDKQIAPGQLDLVHGNGSGVVAFDKLSGEVKYKFSDELASYASPSWPRLPAGDGALSLLAAGCWVFEPASGKLDFHFPWRAAILESVNASTPVVVDDACSFPKPTAPAPPF